jgi:hypothetical protein
MNTGKRFFYFQLSVILFLVVGLVLAPSHSQAADQKIGYVYDVIEPSLDGVKWSEQGGIEVAPTWISDGSWYDLSIQQSLVNSGDIFVSWYEYFNWSVVTSMYYVPFTSIPDFVNYSTSNPNWWISYMWRLDTDFYGISANKTKVVCNFNETSSEVEMWIYFHITRIPEYFVSRGGLQNWLTGFDLTSVSTGNLQAWEFYEIWNRNGTRYNLYFKAPASLLSQHGNNYTFSIGVSSLYTGQNFSTQQAIDINMPANTEIKEATPSELAICKGNTASFVKGTADHYPAAFTVTSGVPAKSMAQVVWDNLSLWFLTPAGWAAIASLSVLSFTGLRGRRIWNRNRLYHRVYKSMVSIYDMYSQDLIKFNQEMDHMSRSIIKMLVQDRITDDQFEKLLQRRDDLLSRARQ